MIRSQKLLRLCLTAFIFFGIVGVTPCAAQKNTIKDDESLVRAFVDVFNNRKLDEMLEMVTDDFEWVAIEGAKASVHLKGKSALKKELEQYFRQCSSCKSTLKWVQSSGSRIIALEEASWMSKNVSRSQSSLSVYEFDGGHIARVFYFPVERARN